MPNIGSYHPIIVHFAIALLVVGVIFRWISLTGRVAFAGPAAATLILAGTVVALLAVRSGTRCARAGRADPRRPTGSHGP